MRNEVKNKGLREFPVALLDRARVIAALRERGYIVRDQSRGLRYGVTIWDARRVRLDADGLVKDDGYCGKITRTGLYASPDRGLEPILEQLNLSS
jgi:hypothetical protein